MVDKVLSKRFLSLLDGNSRQKSLFSALKSRQILIFTTGPQIRALPII